MNEFVASNRKLWDEWAAINARSAFYDLEGFKAGGVRLRPSEIEEVGDVAGKDLLHLQCHFGMDSLSWARLGARVTGADFSEPAVRLARDLAEGLDLLATFVCSTIEDLPDVLAGDFDVVYTSRGVIGWLPDLRRWAEVVAHFLRPGGLLYIREGHPFMWVFDDDDGVTDLRVRYPYFEREEPLRVPVRGSYADRTAATVSEFEYSFLHGLGDVVTSLADAGLHIESLREHPYLEWPSPFLEPGEDGTWWLPANHKGEIPLSFSIRATKPR